MRTVRTGPGSRGRNGTQTSVVFSLVAWCLGAALLLGCQPGDDPADAKPQQSVSPVGKASPRDTPVPEPPLRITVIPTEGDAPVDPGEQVKVHINHGTLTSVRVLPEEAWESGAAEVTGTWGSGRRSWYSDRPMTPGTRYSVQVEAQSRGGNHATRHTTFTTRTAGLTNTVTVAPKDASVVGVGQPLSIRFEHPVQNRAAVERRLAVTTQPEVQGSWGWVLDAQTGHERVDWRPRGYWASGTRVTLRARLSGVDTGGGRYLVKDASTTFTIGVKRVSRVDLRSKTMNVYENGRRVRTIPVSGGQPRYPTWSGTMVVLGKEPTVRMTSESVGISDFYDKTVRWAVHLTISGTYTHAAPWNARLFGRANASHGCIGMSDADGRWFFERAVPGDVVEVTGSGKGTVSAGNGYGDWNTPYDLWRRLSALSGGSSVPSPKDY